MELYILLCSSKYQLLEIQRKRIMKNILFIVGSLRKGSFNHQLAEEAEKMLAGKANVSYLDYSQVPVFNQDLESPVLPVLAEVREQIFGSRRNLEFFSPVYNFSIPGPVKNLLDWLSRALDLSDPSGPSALQDKIVTVSSVANGGHNQLFDAYKDLLPFIRTQVVGDFTATRVNDTAWADGKFLATEEVLESLQNQAEALIEAIK